MKDQQKETSENITHIILHFLKVIKNMNQFSKTGMKSQVNITKKRDNYLG